jgi:hypothetical protein
MALAGAGAWERTKPIELRASLRPHVLRKTLEGPNSTDENKL